VKRVGRRLPDGRLRIYARRIYTRAELLKWIDEVRALRDKTWPTFRVIQGGRRDAPKA
jgi:hypothetical protein